jgi:VanZ family protein
MARKPEETPSELIDTLCRTLEDVTDRFEDALQSVHATRTDRQIIRFAKSLVLRAAVYRAALDRTA